MKRVPVDSSAVRTVGYDDQSSVLEIVFTDGACYEYRSVPRQHFETMTDGSTSVGRYLARKIKGHYRYRQIR